MTQRAATLLFVYLLFFLVLCCQAQLSNFADEKKKHFGESISKDDDFVDEKEAGDPSTRQVKPSFSDVKGEPEVENLSEVDINAMIKNNEIEMVVDDSGRKRLKLVTWAPSATPLPSSQPSRQPTRQPTTQARYFL